MIEDLGATEQGKVFGLRQPQGAPCPQKQRKVPPWFFFSEACQKARSDFTREKLAVFDTLQLENSSFSGCRSAI